MSDRVSDIACGASPSPAESPGRLRAQSLWSGVGFGDVKVRKCKSHLGRRMVVCDRQAPNLSPPGSSARRVTTYVESTAPAVLARPETTLWSLPANPCDGVRSGQFSGIATRGWGIKQHFNTFRSHPPPPIAGAGSTASGRGVPPP